MTRSEDTRIGNTALKLGQDMRDVIERFENSSGFNVSDELRALRRAREAWERFMLERPAQPTPAPEQTMTIAGRSIPQAEKIAQLEETVRCRESERDAAWDQFKGEQSRVAELEKQLASSWERYRFMEELRGEHCAAQCKAESQLAKAMPVMEAADKACSALLDGDPLDPDAVEHQIQSHRDTLPEFCRAIARRHQAALSALLIEDEGVGGMISIATHYRNGGGGCPGKADRVASPRAAIERMVEDIATANPLLAERIDTPRGRDLLRLAIVEDYFYRRRVLDTDECKRLVSGSIELAKEFPTVKALLEIKDREFR